MVATIAVAMVVACAPPGLRDRPWKRATATAVEGDRLPARAGESERSLRLPCSGAAGGYVANVLISL
jgi:hypothetical protein